MGVEPNPTTARKAWPSMNHLILSTLQPVYFNLKIFLHRVTIYGYSIVRVYLLFIWRFQGFNIFLFYQYCTTAVLGKVVLLKYEASRKIFKSQKGSQKLREIITTVSEFHAFV